jgi:hypothetical protein
MVKVELALFTLYSVDVTRKVVGYIKTPSLSCHPLPGSAAEAS